MKTFIVGLLVLSVIGLFGIATVLGAFNADANLRSRIEAFQRQQEASFDTMRKVIAQKQGLPAAAKKDLLELTRELVAGRQGGSLLKSVQEQYPDFNMALYRDLSRSIEAQRDKFFRVQSELFDAKREHDALLRRPISGTLLAMAGRQPVNIVVVSSSSAKEIVQNGLEDDIK